MKQFSRFFGSIRFKLLGSFLFIIIINAISGYVSYENIKKVSRLVNVTYDKALMSGTFSQAAKFNFSRMDSTIQSALLAKTEKSFKINTILAQDAYETLLEDLAVVEERSLDQSKNSLIKTVKEDLNKIKLEKDEILKKKSILMNGRSSLSQSTNLFEYWDELSLKKNLLRKLTAIHDNAAELGYSFRLESDRKNKEVIQRTLIIIVSCLIFGIFTSLLITLLIIKPLFKLQKVCLQVNEGDFNIRSKIKRKDELGDLSNAFDFMLNTIQKKTEDISSLLAALPIGLFYVDKDGGISREKSPATSNIFPEFEKNQTISNFFNGHGISSQQIGQVLGAAFGKMLPFKAAMNLLPRNLTFKDRENNDRFIDLSFEPNQSSNGDLEKIIFLAEDITEKKANEQERVQLFERVERISKVSYDLEDFKLFTPRANELFLSCGNQLEKTPVSNLEEVKRGLHTIKGLLGLYSFNSCADLVHKAEELLSSTEQEEAEAKAKEQLDSAISLFNEQVRDLNEILGLAQKEQSITIPKQKIENIKETVKSGGSTSEVLELIHSLNYSSFMVLENKYKNYLSERLSELPDKKIDIGVKSNIELPPTTLKDINSILIHLVNNSLSHGIETTQLRAEAGKEETGLISLEAKWDENGNLLIIYKDDGKGICANTILESALSKGILTPETGEKLTDKEKVNLIFESGFSTESNATSISGRGVGMDAIKSLVEEKHGTLNLETKVGEFLEIKITFPKEGILHNEP